MLNRARADYSCRSRLVRNRQLLRMRSAVRYKNVTLPALRLEMVYNAGAKIVGVSIRPMSRGSNRVRGGV